MFCPACGSEYRPGFTHCASCDVDLVDDLPAPDPASTPDVRSNRSSPSVIAKDQPMLAFCGFLSLEEASEARSRLRREGIRSEILIREDEPVAGESPAANDTYWLRLSPASFKSAAALLGHDDAEGASREDEETVSCSECGEDLAADETLCPHCGARFEES